MSKDSPPVAGAHDKQPDIDPLFEEIYSELKRHARMSLSRLPHGETLTPTALVSETYLKLSQAARLDTTSRRHFFAVAARAMRHIIIDQARSARSQKRGGEFQAITLDTAHASLAHTAEELLDLDQALEELGQMSPDQRELVEMKFFAGLSVKDIAGLLDISTRTAWREWKRARAYLLARLQHT